LNPFSNIVELDKDHPHFERGKIITLGAPIGGGKTLTSNSLALHYLESGINVLMFYEHERNAKTFMHYATEQKQKNEKFGILAVAPVCNYNTIKNFNQDIERVILNLQGMFVIIIDGFLFENDKSTFEYKRIKDENTRFVLFEKFNFKKTLEFEIIEEAAGNFQRTRKMVENLRALCNTFNTHVVITAQQPRSENSVKYPGLNNTTTSSSHMYMSDLYFTSEKNHTGKEIINESEFTISLVKSRYSPDGQSIKCQLDKNNLTFVTK